MERETVTIVSLFNYTIKTNKGGLFIPDGRF